MKLFYQEHAYTLFWEEDRENVQEGTFYLKRLFVSEDGDAVRYYHGQDEDGEEEVSFEHFRKGEWKLFPLYNAEGSGYAIDTRYEGEEDGFTTLQEIRARLGYGLLPPPFTEEEIKRKIAGEE